MSEKLVVRSTGDIPLSLLESLISDGAWNNEAKIDERQTFYKSMEPPSFVQFVNTLPWWGQFVAYAGSAFVAGYLSQAGSALWKNQHTIAKDLGSRLWSLAELLINLQSLVPANTRVEIGFPCRNEFFPAVLTVPEPNIEIAAFQIAALCYHSTALEAFVDSDEFNPALGAWMEVLDDGSIELNWQDQKTLNREQRKFVVN